MFYAINITTSTKNTKKYSSVAINQFPVVLEVDDKEDLYDMLVSEQFANYCQSLITSDKIYRDAKLSIRCIEDDELKDEVLQLDEYVSIKTF